MKKEGAGVAKERFHCYYFCAKLEFMKRIYAAEHKKEASSVFI